VETLFFWFLRFYMREKFPEKVPQLPQAYAKVLSNNTLWRKRKDPEKTLLGPLGSFGVFLGGYKDFQPRNSLYPLDLSNESNESNLSH